MKKTIRLYFNALKLSFCLSFKASAIIMIFRLIALLAGAFVPIVNAKSMRGILDALAAFDSKKSLNWLVVLGIFQIVSAVIGKITNYISTIHSDKISLIISEDVINKVNELDVSYFDNPKLYDELANVTRDIKTIPALVWQVLSSIQILIKLISSAFILSQYISWSPIIIILSCLPNFIMDKKYALKMYEWTRNSVTEMRKMNYSYDTLTSRYFAKDIRLHDLKEYLFKKYRFQWNEWYSKKHKLLSKQFVVSFVTMFLPNIATIFFALLILNGVLDQSLTVGDFSYYISIMGQLTTSVVGIIAIISEIINQKIKIEYYENFKSWKSIVDISGSEKIDSIDEIEFDNVSFTYPNTEKQVLSNISFKIRHGEKIGIVGRNGSGKTTIVKLLLRLYDPTQGRILINGKNIKDYDLNEYYELISSFMQEYINYSFSLKENVLTTQLSNNDCAENVIAACKRSDAYEFVSTWKNGIDEYLTKSFDPSGQELSGGQWQKIALARFFFRNADLLIMDEPSSSIDISSEKKIIDNVFHCYPKSTLILISHRLSNLSDMDAIIVIEGGRIVEMGNHHELMDNKSIYYSLYNIQKEKYK